jgi:hypothetical protein
MESKISEANSHDEIFISVGETLIMAISSVCNLIFICQMQLATDSHPLVRENAARGSFH